MRVRDKVIPVGEDVMNEAKETLEKARVEFVEKAERQFANPYGDPNAKKHTFHAVCKSKYGDVVFVSAADIAGLKEGVSNMEMVERVLAIYEGSLKDFTEKRELVL